MLHLHRAPGRALGVLLVAALVGGGCAVSVSATGAATLDTEARPGGESTAEITSGIGNKDFVLYLALETGGGYLGADDRGYGLVKPGVGVQINRRFYLKFAYTARMLRLDRRVLARHSIGLSASYLFGLGGVTAERSRHGLGPYIQAEVLFVGPTRVGLFTLGLQWRWILFDTSGRSLLFGHS